MDECEFSVSMALYDADMVTRALHRYSDRYHVDFEPVDDRFRLRLVPKTAGGRVDDTLPARLRDDLLDERLRALVRAQTQDLHRALIEAALRGMPVDAATSRT